MCSKKICIYIASVFLFGFLCPIALELLFFRNSFYSELTNGEWSGFLGSFIGGIISGVGTLFAVYITTAETRAIQKSTENHIIEERSINKKNMKKVFTDDIASIVAEYITDISSYFYSCKILEQLDKQKINFNEELHKIDKELSGIHKKIKGIEFADDEFIKGGLEIDELELKKGIVLNELTNVKSEIEQNKHNRVIAIKCFYILNIKLNEINSANELIKELSYIHENSSSTALPVKWISDENDKLIKITTLFINEYIND